MEAVHALTPAILLLLVGVVAALGSRAAGLSPIVGYLLAGMAVGPHGLGWIPEDETTHLLAELGVVFLLFDIGLHFSLRHLWDVRRDVLGFAPLQVLLCAVVFGGFALAWGLPPTFAFLVGAALALSSTAVVIQTLAERGQESCPVGLTATAALVFQDVVAIFLLILAQSAGDPEASVGTTVALAAGEAALAFAAAILVGRFAIGPLFAGVVRSANEEVLTATVLLVVLAAAAMTGALGLSLTLGAFLAGMTISETAYRHLVQTEVKPFRGLLLGFFFITVGMSLDARVLLEEGASVLLFVAALVVLKVPLVGLSAMAFRWSFPGAVQLAFVLAQGSELALVIVALPAVRTALGEAAAAVLITGTAASLALTPTLAALGRKIAGRLRTRAVAPAEETPRRATAPIVLFGMGEAGRTVADGLEAHGIAYDAIELDPERFAKANADGYSVAFGDAGDPRLMETLGLRGRRAIVITVVRYEVSEALTPLMRTRYPDVARFVGVESEEERERFQPLGMRAVVNRAVPKGIELAAVVLAELGAEPTVVGEWMKREQERALEAGTERARPAAAA